jgi:tRNA(Ile)-lysidine synthase
VLIPYLEREFSPGIVDVLAREAAIAREDEDRLQLEAVDLAASVVLRESTTDDALELDRAPLTSMHPALASRVARIALTKLSKGRFVGYEHVNAFLDFVRYAAAGSVLSLPGQHAVCRGPRITLTGGTPRRQLENSFEYPLSIPGEVTLNHQGWAISAEPVADGPSGRLQARGDAVWVSAPALRPPLRVRSRRAGDRFRPLGMGGADKKLQDFLVDRKVPRETRDTLPLVVDGTDRIVWVVGHSIGEDFRVPAPSTGVILLKARRLGGQG